MWKHIIWVMNVTQKINLLKCMWTSKIKRFSKVNTMPNIVSISMLLLSSPSLEQQLNHSYFHSKFHTWLKLALAMWTSKIRRFSKVKTLPNIEAISILLLSSPSSEQQLSHSYLYSKFHSWLKLALSMRTQFLQSSVTNRTCRTVVISN